jgi:choloylglycine hydrolase
LTGSPGLLSVLLAAAAATAGAPTSAGGLVVCPLGEGEPARQAPTAGSIPPAEHCSSFVLNNGGATVFGANYDDSYWDNGLVFVNKRGVVKTSLQAGTTGTRARWVSKYSSLTFSLVGFGYAWAGMNEAGLVLSTMSLRVTRQPAPDARPPLDSGEWMQFILDTCATIEEVLAADAAVRIVTVDHYLVADAHGRAAAVEFLGGRMVVHTGTELPAQVLTNSTYESAIRTWLEYRRAGNTNYWGLDRSLHRFCLAADRADTFRPCDDVVAVAYAFETLDRVAGQRFGGGTSQWSIVFDTTNGRVWYRTVRHPEIRFVDLVRLDPWCMGPVQMLDIHAGPAGDVTDYFFDYSHDLNLDRMRDFLRAWGITFTEEGLLWTVRYLEGFPCLGHLPRRRLERAY